MKKKLILFCFCIVLSLFLMMIFPACGKKTDDKQSQLPVEQKKQSPGKDEGKTLARREKTELEIALIPGDGRTVRALEQAIYVHFSKEVKPDDFSFKINPDPGGWEIHWGKDARQVFLEHANPFLPAIRYELAVAIKSENAKKVIQFTAYGPSSLHLITEDEESGVLDLDTAWLYRFQALFEPEQLPPAYRSPTSLRCGTMTMRDFFTIKNQLKPSTVEELNQYLVRPTHPESVFTRRLIEEEAATQKRSFSFIPKAYAQKQRPTDALPKWYAVKSFAYPVKVWSPKSMQQAQTVLNVIEEKAMYYNFSTLMGKEPLSDEKATNAQGLPDNGGDGSLDIYLVPPANVDYCEGKCIAVHGGKTTPAWILIKQNLSSDDLVAALAHELFHAFQFAFDSHEDDWWMEGTAVWAEDYIDRDMDTEQEYLDGVFFGPEHRLITLTEEDEYHEYSIYLFPYYLGSKFGYEKVAEVWKSCENSNALDAVDGTVDEGMDECFKTFALLNFDIGPYKGSFLDANGPLELYDYHGASLCVLHQEGEETLNFPLPPLSATYILVENLCDPDQTPFIRFDLEDFARNSKVTVQAVIDPETRAIEEDWSDLNERTFCLNREEEDFETIALVIGSSEKESTVFPDLKIEVKEEGCTPSGGFGQFQITQSYEVKWPETGRGLGSYYRYSYTATGRINFEPYDGAGSFEGKAFVQVTERIEEKETVGNPDASPLKETFIIRKGSSEVRCTLGYAWGEEDAGYTFSIDDVKNKSREKVLDYYEGWPGPPVVEINEYTGNSSILSSYLSSYHGGKPARYSLHLKGSYSESTWQNISASWIFSLKDPSERKR